MSQIHYKFQSNNQHDTVTFDGLSISLADLRASILTKSKLAQSEDFTLQIVNAQTEEAYKKETDMIPKNTSVTVTRVPVAKTLKGVDNGENMNEDSHLAYLAKRAESTVNMAEAENIRAMMTESTNDFDPSNYTVRPRIQPALRAGPPPPHYICNKCGKTGHYITSCPQYVPMPGSMRYTRPPPYRMAHGIPNSYLVPADENTPGAVWSKTGYAVPYKDALAYKDAMQKKSNKVVDAPAVQDIETPENFICPICKEIMKFAVKTPCCGTHFCDNCIRTHLLDDEDQSCFKCNEVDVSPDSLLPDHLLRNAIDTFLSKTKSGFRRIKKVEKRLPNSNSSPSLNSLTDPTAGAAGSPAHASPVLNIHPGSSTPERSSTPTQISSQSASIAAPVTARTEPHKAAVTAGSGTTTSVSTAITSPASDAAGAPNSTASHTMPSAGLSSTVPLATAVTSTPAAPVTGSTSSTVAAATLALQTDAPPGTVPIATGTVATSIHTSAGPPMMSSSVGMMVASGSSVGVPAGTTLSTGVLYPVSYSAAVYRQPVGTVMPAQAAQPVPYQQFPPGMRPGFHAATAFPAQPTPGLAPTVVGTCGGLMPPVLSKEEFYKVKAELLEQKIKETTTKKNDPIMDAFSDQFKSAPRHRSRSPRSRSRSRGRRDRSPIRRAKYSRSPRRRTPSPHYYRHISPHRRSPYRYRSRSPPPAYRGDYRVPPHHRSDSYRSSGGRYAEEYYHSSSSSSRRYRDERYYVNGGRPGERYSPYESYYREREPSRYMSPHRYTPPPERRAYSRSPLRELATSVIDTLPPVTQTYEDYRRRHDDDPRRADEAAYLRYEEERRLRYRLEDTHRDSRERDQRERYHEQRDYYKSHSERRTSGERDRHRGSHEYEERRTDQEEKRGDREGKDYRDRDERRKSSDRGGAKSTDKESQPTESDKAEKGETKVKRRKESSSDKKVDKVDSESKKAPRKEKSDRTKSSRDKKRKRKNSSSQDASPERRDTDDQAPSQKKSKSSKGQDNLDKQADDSEAEKPKSETKKSKSKTQVSDKSKSKSSRGKEKASKIKKKSKPGAAASSTKKSDKDVDEPVSPPGSPRPAESVTDVQSTASKPSSSRADSPAVTDLTGDDELSDAEVVEIAMPEKSKWERDDSVSESDTHQQSPSGGAAKTTSPNQQPLSRKVLESADSLIRNKALQPQTQSQHRKVSLPQAELVALIDRQDDSDGSDGKSDLRAKLEKLKRRKSSTSENLSSSEQRLSSAKSTNVEKSEKRKNRHDSSDNSRSGKTSESQQERRTLELRQFSEENFEPDYDDESDKVEQPKTEEASPRSVVEDSSSDSDVSSEVEKKRKRHKRKSSKTSKHKKHKKSSKKSKKHKSRQ